MFYDPRGERGRLLGREGLHTHKGLMGVYKLIFRLVFFPIWLPVFLRRRRIRRLMQAEFAEACIRDRVTDPLQIALKWIEAHPDDTPSFHTVEDTFRKLLARRN